MEFSWPTTSPAPPKQSSIHSLLSPPKERRQDSFDLISARSMADTTPNTSFTADNASQKMGSVSNGSQFGSATPTNNVYLSPVSPQFQDVKDKVSRDEVDGSRDPQLFAASENGDAVLPVDVPLFPRPTRRRDGTEVDTDSTDAAISQHMERVASERSTSSTSTISMPSKSDYKLVASVLRQMAQPMRTDIMRFVREDPAGFLRRNKAELASIGKTPPVKKTASKPAYRKIMSAPTFKKPRTTTTTTTTATPKPRPVRAAPRHPIVQTFYAHGFEDIKRAAPPAAKAPRPISTREDVDYNSIPDYSPPLSSLGNNVKCLKVEWKGSPLPLDKDADRHLLHEAEVAAASALRLSCAQYLTSKRRIFAAKVEKLRQGKEFRKTDAQQACKIDVNKASRLWAAFDRVHWFDRHYFERWL